MKNLMKTLLDLQMPAMLFTAALAGPVAAASSGSENETPLTEGGNAARGKVVFTGEFPNVHGHYLVFTGGLFTT
jgi:hypothetical protein